LWSVGRRRVGGAKGGLFGMPSFRLSLLNNHKEHITSDEDLILAKSEYVGKQMGF